MGIESTENYQLESNKITNSLVYLVGKIREVNKESSALQDATQELELIPVESTTITLKFKRFRTGKIYKFKISIDMMTEELKNLLIKSVLPEYFEVEVLQRQIYFTLMKVNPHEPLDDYKSVKENGLNENDTIYLTKDLYYEDSR